MSELRFSAATPYTPSPPPYTLSPVLDYWLILSLLMLILLASLAVFLTLVTRHTTGRGTTARWEWCGDHGFKGGLLGSMKLPGLEDLPHHNLRVVEHYRTPTISILRAQSFEEDGRDKEGAGGIWHLLIAETEHFWPIVALRPSSAKNSLIDLMGLQVFPKLSSESRFTVCGLAAIEARKLAAGPVRALIPPDIGLIRSADRLIIDFSARPFDPVEFSRMLAIAEQVLPLVD